MSVVEIRAVVPIWCPWSDQSRSPMTGSYAHRYQEPLRLVSHCCWPVGSMPCPAGACPSHLRRAGLGSPIVVARTKINRPSLAHNHARADRSMASTHETEAHAARDNSSSGQPSPVAHQNKTQTEKYRASLRNLRVKSSKREAKAARCRQERCPTGLTLPHPRGTGACCAQGDRRDRRR